MLSAVLAHAESRDTSSKNDRECLLYRSEAVQEEGDRRKKRKKNRKSKLVPIAGQLSGFWARGSSAAAPMPKMRSVGLASAMGRLPVPRSTARISAFWPNLSSSPRYMTSSRHAAHTASS